MSLAEAFRYQSISCAAMGSPFMGQLLGLLSEHWPEESALAQRFDRFQGDIGPSGHSLPLRIAGGLHALVLSGRAPDLAALYPPEKATDPELLAGVLEALTTHENFLLDWVESPPQTNEVRRSAALMAGAAVAAARVDMPVVLSELGASGGLNLMWDRYALVLGRGVVASSDPVLTLTPDWDGPMPPQRLPHVTARAGVDLNPLNPADPADLLRLMAYLWPDQPERLELTRAAVAVMDAPLYRADAIDWLEQRLVEAPEGHLHLIQHTVAWQYFPAEAQARGTALIEAMGARATPERPLAWLSMESDGDKTGAVGAVLSLRLWPGDVHLTLGRADFHGRWIRWQGAA
ncbi:DUF2332 domain-containing protein [Roseobacter sinensis]|uniref:DUF2332 family protein n=1 Tax=Roseobacter sinensis TaxID=2931391 RepID=A0ABT3BA83_9RHOB|nr:DUF2332 family protein [Roseobacter sp. WL0113]MCV3270467.1 DUF2332 family protein [Roseobacter sp. WL0113]